MFPELTGYATTGTLTVSLALGQVWYLLSMVSLTADNRSNGNQVDRALGYDCPTYSKYLNATYRQGEKSYTRFNAICEFNHGAPSLGGR